MYTSNLSPNLSFHFTISPIVFGPLGLATQDASPTSGRFDKDGRSKHQSQSLEFIKTKGQYQERCVIWDGWTVVAR